MKRSTRELWYDRLHKGFVVTCVGFSLVGSVILGIQVYEFLTVIRPLRRQLREERERELLKEGMDAANTNT